MMEIKEIVQQHIQKGRLKNAIQELLHWATEQEQDELKEKCSLLSFKLKEVEGQVNMGLIDYNSASQEKARITKATLDLLQDTEETSIERGLDIPPIPPPLQSNTILFLAANPAETTQLQLKEECTDIAHSMQDNQQFRLVSEWATTPDKLQDAILKYRPRYVHFSGHGTSPDGTIPANGRGLVQRTNLDQSGIILEDNKGESKVVSGTKLQAMFTAFAKKIQMEAVVLNACYSEDQARMIAKCIKYVVGMSDSVQDDAAIQFSKSFYRTLASEPDVEFAFELAKNNISMYDHDSEVLALYKDGERLI